MRTIPSERPSEQERQQVRQMDVESLTGYLFRYLKENLSSSPGSCDFFYGVESLRKALFPDGVENQSDHDRFKLLEAIVLLERRGLVVRDFSYPKPIFGPLGKDTFIVYLTSIGMKSDFDDEILLLVDNPQEIVDALEQKIGTLDNVVRQYYLESLRAYQEGLYISSVIVLGAASERAIHWLAESIESYSKQYQKEIKKRRSGNILRLTEYLSNTVIPNIFGLDKKFAGELKTRLNGLGTVYRENRNEAGHPQTVDQSWLREDQETLLLHFRRYITTICKAIGECHAKSRPTTASGHVN